MPRFIGQCDVVRRRGANDEAKWQAMMNCAEPVSLETFLSNVDISPLLDDDETDREWLANAFAQDPSAGLYRSWWGTERAWFIQASGFEFIFVE